MNNEEWLEDLEDMELVPTVEAAREEYKEKGGRTWVEVEIELDKWLK